MRLRAVDMHRGIPEKEHPGGRRAELRDVKWVETDKSDQCRVSVCRTTRNCDRSNRATAMIRWLTARRISSRRIRDGFRREVG